MNLIIDIGNSFIKAAVYNENELVKHYSFEDLDEKKIKHLLIKDGFYDVINAAIISAVIDYPVSFNDFIKKKYTLIILNSDTSLPIKNAYKTPETLGKDRLAAATGANFLFPKQNVLCIDIGTCIKYDFVSEAGTYLGGAISPGMHMRFKSLNTFTGKLPLVQNKELKSVIGDTTESSILSGVINGIINEIDGMIGFYDKKFPQLQLVLSGGDSKYFADKIKFRIFAIQNIVTLGLNIILNHNKSAN